jgi:hypothetical protein
MYWPVRNGMKWQKIGSSGIRFCSTRRLEDSNDYLQIHKRPNNVSNAEQSPPSKWVGKSKVVPVLFLTEHHATKAYWGSECIAPRILWPRWRGSVWIHIYLWGWEALQGTIFVFSLWQLIGLNKIVPVLKHHAVKAQRPNRSKVPHIPHWSTRRGVIGSWSSWFTPDERTMEVEDRWNLKSRCRRGSRRTSRGPNNPNSLLRR